MLLLTTILFVFSILIYKFLAKAQWSETWFVGVLAFVICSLINLGIYFAGTRQDYYSEVWNYKGTAITYYEPWNEKVSCRHPKYKTVKVKKKDSNGKEYIANERIQDGYQHFYDVDYHNAEYKVTTEYGNDIEINRETYDYWSNYWGNVKFLDMNRRYYTINGNAYRAIFNGDFDKIYPIEHVGSYKNPIRVSKSVFNYTEVDDATKKKYYRPADRFDLGGIVSYDGVYFSEEEKTLMRRVNAFLGSAHKIHIIILLFDSKTASTEMNKVLASWKGPNKNELIVSVGIDNNRNIIWSQCYSWCDDTTIHAKIRQDVLESKILDFNKIKDILLKNVPQYWHKKSFKDFNYIQNPLPNICYFISFIINSIIYITGGIILYKGFKLK